MGRWGRAGAAADVVVGPMKEGWCLRQPKLTSSGVLLLGVGVPETSENRFQAYRPAALWAATGRDIRVHVLGLLGGGLMDARVRGAQDGGRPNAALNSPGCHIPAGGRDEEAPSHGAGATEALG